MFTDADPAEALVYIPSHDLFETVFGVIAELPAVPAVYRNFLNGIH
jgi:hypothetical protein